MADRLRDRCLQKRWYATKDEAQAAVDHLRRIGVIAHPQFAYICKVCGGAHACHLKYRVRR
jgi:hypothetical protein